MAIRLADIVESMAWESDVRDPDALVYFFLRGDGLIKIGWTANVDQRERTLKTAAGPLMLLATIRGGRFTEKHLHEVFSESRVWPRQEWFYPTPPLLDLINQAVDSL